jgi:hypothetical protein
VVVEVGADLTTEGADELLIVTPPERPADEPIAETTQALSPREVHGKPRLCETTILSDPDRTRETVCLAQGSH